MSEAEGPQRGYADNHYCVPVVHHCWETCGYRLHHGYGAVSDYDYIRWEDRAGHAGRQNLDERTYADLDASGRVIGVGFRQSHGPEGCRHPEYARDHIGIETPGRPFHGPLLDDVLAHEPCNCAGSVPGAISVAMYPEDGGVVGRTWMLDSAEQAQALIAELTERFGESQEVALDRIGFSHMQDAAELNAIYSTPA